MKIFFVSKTFLNIFKHRFFPVVFVLILFIALLISQLATHLENASEQVVSSSIAQSNFYVTLEFSGTVPKDGAKVYLNGEEHSVIETTSVTVNLERNSVIEIFCETKSEFSVSVKPSNGTSVISDTDNTICKKGMNYICRCFF